MAQLLVINLQSKPKVMFNQLNQDSIQELKQQYLILKNQAQNFMRNGDLNNYLKKLMEIQAIKNMNNISIQW